MPSNFKYLQFHRDFCQVAAGHAIRSLRTWVQSLSSKLKPARETGCCKQSRGTSLQALENHGKMGHLNDGSHRLKLGVDRKLGQWPGAGLDLRFGAMRADINHRPTSRVAEFRS